MRIAAFARAMQHGYPRRIHPVLPQRAHEPAPARAPVIHGAYGEPANRRDLDAWVANSAQVHLQRLEQDGKYDADSPQVRLLTGMVEHHQAQENFVAHKSVGNANAVREELKNIIYALHDERAQMQMGAEALATNIAMEERARRQMDAINATGF